MSIETYLCNIADNAQDVVYGASDNGNIIDIRFSSDSYMPDISLEADKAEDVQPTGITLMHIKLSRCQAADLCLALMALLDTGSDYA